MTVIVPPRRVDGDDAARVGGERDRPFAGVELARRVAAGLERVHLAVGGARDPQRAGRERDVAGVGARPSGANVARRARVAPGIDRRRRPRRSPTAPFAPAASAPARRRRASGRADRASTRDVRVSTARATASATRPPSAAAGTTTASGAASRGERRAAPRRPPPAARTPGRPTAARAAPRSAAKARRGPRRGGRRGGGGEGGDAQRYPHWHNFSSGPRTCIGSRRGSLGALALVTRDDRARDVAHAGEAAAPERLPLAERLDLGVVAVEARVGGDQVHGSGTVVDADAGLILTSARSVWGATSLKLDTGLGILHGRIVARAPCDELALDRDPAAPAGPRLARRQRRSGARAGRS